MPFFSTIDAQTQNCVDMTPSRTNYRHTILTSRSPLFAQKAGSFPPLSEIAAEKEYHQCPGGIYGWGEYPPRTLYVEKGAMSCSEATKIFVKTVIKMAPYTDEEKNTMPFGESTFVYDENKPPYLIKESTRKLLLTPCGFGKEHRGQGYISSDSKCRDLSLFLTTLNETWGSPKDSHN